MFDGDVLLNHNAFRAPGAISLEKLRERPMKVDHYGDIYDSFRRGIVRHPYPVTEANAEELDQMDFAFLCMDAGPDKLAAVNRLEAAGVAFIDTGMGLQEEDGSIGGVVRVTTSTPEQRQHVWDSKRISFEDPDAGANEYARNIQVADLNAFNASLAVMRWKKLYGFYRDFEQEHNSLFTVDGNHLINEDQA